MKNCRCDNGTGIPCEHDMTQEDGLCDGCRDRSCETLWRMRQDAIKALEEMRLRPISYPFQNAWLDFN